MISFMILNISDYKQMNIIMGSQCNLILVAGITLQTVTLILLCHKESLPAVSKSWRMTKLGQEIHYIGH